jgi:hypothetical protein
MKSQYIQVTKISYELMNFRRSIYLFPSAVFYCSGIQPGVREDILGGT